MLSRKNTSDSTQIKSLYSPDTRTKNRIQKSVKEYQVAYDVQIKSRPEFNHRNILQEIDSGQKAFNSYIPKRSKDPDEMWRAQTVRPVTRNKLISIAAHAMVTILYPNVFAQNSSDKEDKNAATAMRFLVEYNIENSRYKKEFLNTVIGMLTDPYSVMHIDFTKVVRKVKDKQNTDGTWSLKEIVDEVLSGFQANYVPAREILFTNFYESEINKQRRIFRHKLVDYDEAKRLYGSHKDFVHVKPGVEIIFAPQDNGATFYGVKNPELQDSLVSVDIEYSYALDLEIVYVGGILVTDPDRPLQHPDHVLPFAKSGYEPLNNGKCFAYFSAARKLGSDQEIVDTLYNMIIDGSFMSLMPPLALYGNEDVDGSVMIPGAITSFRDKDAKLDNIAPRSDLRGGIEAIGLVERSISESSQDSSRQGLQPGGAQQTARQSLLLERNAQIAMGMFGKMIAFLVEDIGKLMIPLILRHQTVADMDGILSPMQKLKFKSFIVPNTTINGKKGSAKIRFSDSFMNFDGMTEEEIMAMSFNLLKEEGVDSDTTIFNLNPPAFRKIKYSVKVDADQLNPKNKSLDKALNLELYDRAIQNPTVDQDKVTEEFLFDSYKPGEGYKYMKNLSQDQKQQIDQNRINGGAKAGGINQNTVGQLTGNNSLSVASSTQG